jgi:hypothetical protein
MDSGTINPYGFWTVSHYQKERHFAKKNTLLTALAVSGFVPRYR